MKRQTYYTTASEAMNELAKKGYTTDFEVLKEQDCLVCKQTAQQLSPDEFIIDETHRFDGETDPGDEMIVYAISSQKHSLKGIVVNGYGTYADPDIFKIVERLKQKSITKEKPIKRSEILKPLSREHHHALLLCWKIKNGLNKGVSPERIKKYADWFFKQHLLPHFDIEEKYVFIVLGDEHPMVKKAKGDHQHLIQLFTTDGNLEQKLQTIEETLQNHVRFEERTLFNEVQKYATESQLKDIETFHVEEKFEDNMADPFWV
ncbi:hemerythrin domain-containing protein [Pedobacter changchengzhani]|nr:hemerythrin domain-containing protein [Pedobacter changchengzhani]